MIIIYKTENNLITKRANANEIKICKALELNSQRIACVHCGDKTAVAQRNCCSIRVTHWYSVLKRKKVSLKQFEKG